MGNAARADVINSVNVLIRDRANSGISWGTNNYPANANPGWFSGPNSGVPVSLDYSAPSLNQQPTGRAVTTDINNFINNFRNIRMMRIVIYFNTNGVNNVIYDGTALANSDEGLPWTGDNPPVISANTPLSLGIVNDYCDRIWWRYYNASRGAAVTRINYVCHSSCHGSCHNSRGRR